MRRSNTERHEPSFMRIGRARVRVRFESLPPNKRVYTGCGKGETGQGGGRIGQLLLGRRRLRRKGLRLAQAEAASRFRKRAATTSTPPLRATADGVLASRRR